MDSLKQELSNERKIFLFNKDYILAMEYNLDRLNQLNNQCKQKIGDLKNINNNHVAVIKDNNDKIKSLESTIVSLNNKIEELENDMSVNNLKKDFNDDKIKSLESSIIYLNNENNELKRNIELLMSKNQEQENYIKKLIKGNEK